MDTINEDLDDSALCSLSLVQKRKASGSLSQKKSKQAKLNFYVTHENNEQEQLHKNLKMEESTSTYFDGRNSSMCPLCLKIIESNVGLMTHTKSCAKKHSMTTQDLLQALDLQKKHMKERKELGLSSQVVPLNKKVIKNKAEKSLDSYDVALGLALSKSLEETKAAHSEKGKATVEEFRLASNPVSSRSGPSSRRNKLLRKSVLKERTDTERQRIITEKVAMVLLDEDPESDFEKETTVKVELKKQLGDIVNEDSHLWNLGENEGKFDWYVREMKPLILIEDEEVPETCTKDETPGQCSPKDVWDPLPQLNLKSESLSADWKKMINNSKLSDLVVKTKDSQSIYLHSLVLQARCANVLEKDYRSIFAKFSLLTVLIFLEFLYSGTLDSLTGPEVKNLSILAGEFDYEELLQVLNCLETSVGVGKSPKAEINVTETDPEIARVEDKDLFLEDVVDLTQNSHSTNEEKDSEDDSNVEKSFWSFMQQEKKREEELREEEERENSLFYIEREKIEMNMKKRDEEMQKIMDSEEESNFRDSLELEKISESQRISSPVCAFRDNTSDCIILSSDSETRFSKPEIESPDLKIPSPPVLEYEIPCYDPYDDMIASSALSPVDSHSESLISKNTFCEFPHPEENEAEHKPGYCSTPITKRGHSKAQFSNKKPLTLKRRSDLSASRIIRKSLNLQSKKRSSILAKGKTLKRKCIKGKNSDEVLSASVLGDFSKSFTCEASSPKSIKRFVEMTPVPERDEFGESVTPSPNYSNMGDSVLKEHLSRYGLKKSIGKSKAKKILRHIYEELHPRINTETGKIVKVLSTDTPTRKKIKTKRKVSRKMTKQKMTEPKSKTANSSEETLKASDESLGRIMDDSCGSEFEELNEPLTQSLPDDPEDLPSAFRKFIENDSEFHKKILLYEPIWLEDLQSTLKEMFKKHFKLSDLMDFLDQKCITFRTQAQKRVNQKRTEKKKSPRKKITR